MSAKGVELKAVENKICSESKKKLDSIHPSSVVSLRPDLRWQRSRLSASLTNIIHRAVSTCLPWSFWSASTDLVRNWGRTTKTIGELWKGYFLFSNVIQTETTFFFPLIGPNRNQNSPLETKLPFFHSKFPWANSPSRQFSRTQRSWRVPSRLYQERRSCCI